MNDSAAPFLRVVADDRENAGGVIDLLRMRPGLDVEVRRLPVGDFEVGRSILLERKTTSDLVRSIIDGRLFTQAAKMAQAARRGVLILEGRTPADMGVSRAAIQGALVTLTAFYGLGILRAADITETSWLILNLAQQACRVATGALPRSGNRPSGRRRRQLFILQGLPGIGPYRAGKLLDRFQSIRSVINASETDLAEVDGIGPIVAGRICQSLG